jgi:hypothetical protein
MGPIAGPFLRCLPSDPRRCAGGSGGRESVSSASSRSVRYARAVSHSSLISAVSADTSRKSDASLGNNVAALELLVHALERHRFETVLRQNLDDSIDRAASLFLVVDQVASFRRRSDGSRSEARRPPSC